MALEAHGAMVFLVVWSLWVARRPPDGGPFKRRFSGLRSNDDGLPVTYRTAWIGFFVCTLFLMGWFKSVGFGLPATLLQLTLLFIAYFAVSKYAAATGFRVFWSPPGRKGWLIMKSIFWHSKLYATGPHRYTGRTRVGIQRGGPPGWWRFRRLLTSSG